MKFIISFLLFSILGMNVQAQELADFGIEKGTEGKGLKVGEKAPMFIGEDQYGGRKELKDALKEKPVVLIFYRGHWCPLCNKHIANVSDSLSELSKKAHVWFVTPELPEHVAKTDAEFGGELVIVTDNGEKIMDAYKVGFEVTEDYNQKVVQYFGNDLNGFNGQDTAKLPVPATYIIDQDGNISYVHFDYNYGNRASVAEILEQL